MDDLITEILPPLLAAFAVSFGLAYFNKKAKEHTDDGTLGYGPEVKVLGWLSMAIVCGVILVMCFVDHGGEFRPLAGIGGIFGVLGLYLLAECYMTKGHFDDEQILMSSAWSQPKRGLWKELESASFKKNGQYFPPVIGLKPFVAQLDSDLAFGSAVG